MLKIVQEGAIVLRKKAKPVPEKLFGSPELSRMLTDMADALDPETDGVALAAPQIALPYRIFIVREDRTLPAPRENAPAPVAAVMVFINPEIVRTSRKRQKADEGCLSVRGVYGATSRHARITIRARREDGGAFERGAGGLLAQIFEHEIDHLNGILFIDHAKDVVRLRHPHEYAA